MMMLMLLLLLMMMMMNDDDVRLLKSSFMLFNFANSVWYRDHIRIIFAMKILTMIMMAS